MSTQIDWHEELDASIGRAPDLPAAQYVVAGRRAVRRRRIGTGIAGLATAAVVAGLGWATMLGGSPQSQDSTIATNPTSTPPSATSSPTLKPSMGIAWRKGDPPARVDLLLGLEIREGAVIHERRDDLFPDKATESVALDLSFKGTRWWMTLEWDEGGGTSASSKPGEMFSSFDAFVAAEVASGGLSSQPEETGSDDWAYADAVNFGVDGLELREGATVLRRVDNPHRLDPPDASIGLAVEFEGEVTWMSLTASDGGGSGATESPDESGWLTFDRWLAADVALQAGKPGLELLEMDDRGRLTAAQSAVEILDQRADPDVPSYTDPSVTASGVAMVSWKGDTWFVLVLRTPTQDSVTTFAASKAGGAASIDEFLDFAEARAGEGGGLR